MEVIVMGVLRYLTDLRLGAAFGGIEIARTTSLLDASQVTNDSI
jgi:hypothetical protein